jgi:hypothetical protein
LSSKCAGKKLERAPDNITTEKAIMGQQYNQRQDANDGRNAIKDQVMIQVFP